MDNNNNGNVNGNSSKSRMTYRNYDMFTLPASDLALIEESYDTKDTQHILYEVDDVLQTTEDPNTYIVMLGHPVLEVESIRLVIKHAFTQMGRTATFIRSKYELCGVVIGLSTSELLAYETGHIQGMDVTEDTKREASDFIITLFKQLQLPENTNGLNVDYSHITVRKHGRRVAADAVICINDTFRVVHACFGSDNYMFHVSIGNHSYYEDPCLEYTFGMDEFTDSVNKIVTEICAHLKTARLEIDMAYKAHESDKDISNMTSQTDAADMPNPVNAAGSSSDTATDTATTSELVQGNENNSSEKLLIKMSASEKTAAILHQLFNEDIKKHDTFPRTEEQYNLAEYFANIFNYLCYRQLTMQGLDFVLFGVTFKTMPETIGISFLAASRELAETDREAAAKESKKNRMFIGVSPTTSIVEFAYSVGGMRSPIIVLTLTDSTDTREMRDWVDARVTDFVTAMKLYNVA